ncbi:hypothetical protein [Methylococcus mesophilus]|uniref:hypothetical protein n=1 Tax=Methylococcus mesophilus TaxID=2993564 RepID=UPI00224A9430|nr:hypothetical protein [Methylococcus mesophilus]UZR30743.1 hypothetical protein OOT43_08985 [Methylococcus mesophilus]
MSDPFGFLDAIFGGGGGGGYSSTQGGPRLDQGFAPVAGWMVGQAFADAGPVGQYLGMLYGSPGTGIPRVEWGTDYASQVDYGDYLDFTQSQVFADSPDYSASVRVVDTSDSAPSRPAEPRTLEVLDRGDSGAVPAAEPIEVVHVFGTPPDRPSKNDWFESFLSTPRNNTFSGGEIKLWVDNPLPRPPRPPRPQRSAGRKGSPVETTSPLPELPPPERDPVDSGPYFNVEGTPLTVPGSDQATNPWMSDAAVPERFLPWGSWDRPENKPSPRWERGDTGRIEAVPTVPVERSFWSRGGTGLAAGAVTAGLGVAALMWWNPVGWVALGTALAIAGGVAATTASAVELTASYSGATSLEQDAEMNRAISATLGYSSPGGVIGSVLGTVVADDPQEGFAQGALWGGLTEGVTSLPGALRAVPGLWRAALPWTKSLLLTPFWFFMSAGGGGGRARSLARVFAAQGRIASRVRSVEYLGTTPLLERDADWARFQVFATRTRNESVFRITYANGQQRIVLADRAQPTGRAILEAKYGDMGQMWNPTREAHIIGQANNYLDIATVTGGRVGYLVSTERGAYRLTQRFGLEFPAEMASGQLWIDWVPWRR